MSEGPGGLVIGGGTLGWEWADLTRFSSNIETDENLHLWGH